MNDIERKQKNLLIYLLEQINDAITNVEADDDDWYTLNFRYEPIFNFDEDDVEAIKSLAEDEPCCEELYDMIINSKQN